MYNWSTDTTRLKKDRPAFLKWKLEQMINFGLNNKKIKRKELKKNINFLSIDPKKSRFLKFLLYDKIFAH